MNENQEIYENYIEETIEAINAGNYLTAYNVLHKAEQINPNGEEVIELLHFIESHLNSKDDSEIPHIRLRTRNKNNSNYKKYSSNEEDKSDKNEEKNENHYKQSDNEYTQEQYEIVKKIEKCKNYYEVLDVERNATDLEIRKAYKKLALQLHPDKNRAPGAIEAFKAIGNAVAILTDPQKRHEYDLFGSKRHENGIYHNHNQRYPSRRQQNNNYETAYEYGFESNISAEELFNIFFGNDFSSTSFMSSRARRNRNVYHHHRDDELSEHAIIAFAIIIILIIMSILSSLFSSDPLYNLSQNSYIFYF